MAAPPVSSARRRSADSASRAASPSFTLSPHPRRVEIAWATSGPLVRASAFRALSIIAKRRLFSRTGASPNVDSPLRASRTPDTTVPSLVNAPRGRRTRSQETIWTSTRGPSVRGRNPARLATARFRFGAVMWRKSRNTTRRAPAGPGGAGAGDAAGEGPGGAVSAAGTTGAFVFLTNEKFEMACALPSCVTTKSRGVRSVTGRPFASVTTTSTFVIETSTERATLGSGSAAGASRGASAAASRPARIRFISLKTLPDESRPEAKLIGPPGRVEGKEAAGGAWTRVRGTHAGVGRDRLEEELVDLDRGLQVDLAPRGGIAEREQRVGVSLLVKQPLLVGQPREVEDRERKGREGEKAESFDERRARRSDGRVRSGRCRGRRRLGTAGCDRREQRQGENPRALHHVRT